MRERGDREREREGERVMAGENEIGRERKRERERERERVMAVERLLRWQHVMKTLQWFLTQLCSEYLGNCKRSVGLGCRNIVYIDFFLIVFII